MRCSFRSTPAIASVCLIAVLSAAPRRVRAQSGTQTGNQDASQPQVHAITGLPLPPDEDAAPPASTPAVAVAAPKAPRKAAAKVTKVTGKAVPVPEASQPAPPASIPPAPAPAAEPVAPVAEAPAARVRGRKATAAKPAAESHSEAATEPKVHAIMLAPPPDGEPTSAASPASTPAPVAPVAAPTPAVVAAPAAPAPKAVKAAHTTKRVVPSPQPAAPSALPAPSPAPVAAPSPAPVAAPAAEPVVPPAPATKPAEVVPAPAPVVPQPRPKAPTPSPAPTPAPEVPAAAVVAPRPVAAPAPAPARVVTPAKPAPTLKPRSARGPVSVAIPSATVVSPAPAAPVVAPVEKPALVAAPPMLTSTGKLAPKPAAAAAPAASAPPPPPGTLGSILFQGAEPYTQAELAPITGLALGTKPGQDALQLATNRLIDTGLFATVNASYDTPNDAGTATFVVTPMPPNQLAKPSFANLVWLTRAEIDAALKTVPLYHDGIPINGKLDLAAQVQAALERELAARHVDATLVHETVAPTQAHPYVAVEFRATSPRVVLASAQVFDVPPALVNKTLAAQAAAVKVPYNEGDAGVTLSDLLLAPARDAGYIGARLWHVERKRRGVNGTVYVDYSARLEAGPVYAVRSVDWTPTPVLSGAGFSKLSALHVGQAPSAAAQQQTEQAVLNAYYTKGYLEAAVSSSRTLDSKTGAASYAFTVAAGPQYTVRSVDIEGLDPAARKDLLAAWTMKPGDAYDEPYLLNFLANHPGIESLKGYTFGYNRAASTDTHQVDLTLSFKHN